MIEHEWHIDDDDLAAYAHGRSGPVMHSSIEAHLIACARCRDALTAEVHENESATADDRVWAAITDRVDHGNRLFPGRRDCSSSRSRARRWRS